MDRMMLSLMLALSDPEPDKGRRLPVPSGDLDWRAWLSETERQGVLPIISRNLERVSARLNIPPWVSQEAGMHYTAAWGRNMFLENQIEEFARSLAESGVRAIVLKGPALAESVYPEMGMRPFTDIDLLIAPEAAPAFSTLFSRLGYENEGPEMELGKAEGLRKACFVKKVDDLSSCIEVHWDVVNSPSLRARCSVTFEDLAPDAQPWGVCPALSFPCPEDSLLTCLIHMAIGHQFDRLVLFVDVLQILRRGTERGTHLLETLGGASPFPCPASGGFDWPKFFRKADRCGAGLICASSLRLTDDLFPLPMPQEVEGEIRRRLRLPWLWKLVLDGRQAVNSGAWETWVRLHIYREMIKRLGQKRF